MRSPMTVEPPKDDFKIQDSPKMVALRGYVHAVGLRISAYRAFSGMGGSVGIWKWVWEAVNAINGDKAWEYGKVDTESVRRRISELADPLIQDPPLWEHLSLKYVDVDPFTQTTRLQSTYRPREDGPT